MFSKSKRILNDQRGMTFLGVIITIVIVAFISTLVGKAVIDSQAKKSESQIETNKSELETASRSYLLANGKYATDTAKLLKDYPQLSGQHNFQKILVEEFSLTMDEVGSRVQVVDVTSLKMDSYFNGDIDNPENYVIDKVTGKVYYIDEEADLDGYKKLGEQLLKDSNEVIDLSVIEGDVFDLTVGGKSMTRVIASIQDGNKIVLGGGTKGADDIKLMVIEVSPNKKGEASDKKLVDITEKVADGNLKTPITALRLIQPGTVLAHYYHEDELKYQLINY